MLWSALICSVLLTLLKAQLQDTATFVNSRWDRADLSSEDQVSSLTHSLDVAHATGEHDAAATRQDLFTFIYIPAPRVRIRDMKMFSCTGSDKNTLESWLNIFFTKFLKWKAFWVEQIHKELLWEHRNLGGFNEKLAAQKLKFPSVSALRKHKQP